MSKCTILLFQLLNDLHRCRTAQRMFVCSDAFFPAWIWRWYIFGQILSNFNNNFIEFIDRNRIGVFKQLRQDFRAFGRILLQMIDECCFDLAYDIVRIVHILWIYVIHSEIDSTFVRQCLAQIRTLDSRFWCNRTGKWNCKCERRSVKASWWELLVEIVGIVKVWRRDAHETVQSREKDRYLIVNYGGHEFVRLYGKFNFFCVFGTRMNDIYQ